MTEPRSEGRATLAIDAGQTGVKVRLDVGEVRGAAVVLPGVRTQDPLAPQLAGSALVALARFEASADVVSIGASGLKDDAATAAEVLAMLAGTGVRQVLIAHDSVTSFLGTLGDVQGAVIAAGTGVVTLGVGRHFVARVDGWGNLMGDAGSAYWIGRAGMEAAMRAYDGRARPTTLTHRLQDRWPELEDAYVSLQHDPDRVKVIAAFAEEVTAAAAADTAAAQICLEAARELAHSVCVALRRVGDADDAGLSDNPAVGAIGEVFLADVIRKRFYELVAETMPEARFVTATGEGLDGVAILPALTDSHPLGPHVRSARC